MRNYRLMLLSAVTIPLSLLPLSAPSSRAEPCPSQIIARADLRLSAPQSVAAQMHYQPTVASVAAGQKRVFAGAMVDARLRGQQKNMESRKTATASRNDRPPPLIPDRGDG